MSQCQVEVQGLDLACTVVSLDASLAPGYSVWMDSMGYGYDYDYDYDDLETLSLDCD
ncbi:GH19900 [Drosophila grimshawi]|uniref:GH19900 n=1 Tax=Drosophila grimshawi TaxID=7222 RepID=B4J947_DROGR|nr:GH19900 [Drosophila grimshawi]